MPASLSPLHLRILALPIFETFSLRAFRARQSQLGDREHNSLEGNVRER